MGFDIKTELQILTVCLLSGILTGMLYDLFRIIRKGRKNSVAVVFIQDIVFWVTDAFVVFYGLYITCGGELRWYNAPLILSGFLIYHFTVSRLFMKTGFFVLRISLNVTSAVMRILLSPVRIFLKICLFLKKLFKKSKFFKKIRQIRLTYRNFCFKIKKSVHKFCCIVFRR